MTNWAGPTNWAGRFMAMAELVASWSKDPSTKTGCVLVAPDRTVASVGYNGFARGVLDSEDRLSDRPTKLELTVHAEVNAIAAARVLPAGCTAYVWPWPPCAPCASVCVQAGVAGIVAPAPTDEQRERWGASWDLAEAVLAEAGVEYEWAWRL